jgi:ceramide glucosyltransferase
MTWQEGLLVPVGGAILFWLGTAICMAVFWLRRPAYSDDGAFQKLLPTVSVLKPVCGREKELYGNLKTACEQDYPDYEVIYSVQESDDPALEVLQTISRSRSRCRVRIVVDADAVGPNRRLSNTFNASKRAQGEVLVRSDSDMFLRADYLKAIVSPFSDPGVGIACTLYKAWRPSNLFERLELLSINADFVPSLVFAVVTGVSTACTGATLAIRRNVVDEIGGFMPLGHYLVEDYELGRRVLQSGYRIHFVPYVADTGIDLRTWRELWRHRVYWDQNTKSVHPLGFFFTLLIRGIPFGFLYTLMGGPYGIQVLAGTITIRMVTAAINALFMKDLDCVKSIWLLPFCDFLGMASWLSSFVKKEIYVRGKRFVLKKGLLVEMEGSGPGADQGTSFRR